MPSSPIDVLARHLEHVSLTDLSTDPLDLPTLAEVLDTVPDPRSRRGRRYRLGPLLALSLLAVLGGATSLAKIPGPSPDTTQTCAPEPACPARHSWPPAPWDDSSPAWTATPSTPPPAATWPRSLPTPRLPP
ncbi:transposase family protein [Nonomuraea sp. H19]|uniref:transposase family protein n=1 Tax=Nonomuraea sp. H19 TaxID=3452206 RepID=UPI003F89313A